MPSSTPFAGAVRDGTCRSIAPSLITKLRSIRFDFPCMTREQTQIPFLLLGAPSWAASHPYYEHP